jgi:hypothetical protein
MNLNLESAVAIAAVLPESEQERVAAAIHEAIARIKDDARWARKFAGAEEALTTLHDEASRDLLARRTKRTA